MPILQGFEQLVKTENLSAPNHSVDTPAMIDFSAIGARFDLIETKLDELLKSMKSTEAEKQDDDEISVEEEEREEVTEKESE